MNQGTHFDDVICGIKIYYLIVFFTAEILTVYYSSKLLAISTVRLELAPFTNLEEIAEQNEYRITFISGTSGIQDIMDGEYHEFVVLKKKIQQDYDKYVLNLSLFEIEDKLKTENIAYFTIMEYLQYLMKRNKNLEIMENTYLRSGVHIAWRKGFPLARIINTMLMKMKENGQIQRLQKLYFSNSEDFSKPSTDYEIQLSIIYVPLMILAVGIITACALTALEYARISIIK
ncbi:Uncharacterised protein r2_g1041 [Pycnogonum litorale]